MTDMSENVIRFLGTGGGDFFYPEHEGVDHNYLPRVRELGGRNLRWACQALFGPDVLIDFFDDRQIHKFGIPRDSIRHLLITHCHYDHLNPPAILEFASQGAQPLEIYGTELVRDSLEFYAAYQWDQNTGRFQAHATPTNYEYHRVRPQESFRIGETTVTPVQANHSFNKGLWGVPFLPIEHMALNYVIERNGKTLFYGLDSSYTLPLTLEFLGRFQFDVAVLDVTFAQYEIDPAKSGHHNFEMMKKTLGEYRQAGIITDSTRIIASHMSVARAKPHDDLLEEAAQRGIELAYDGMTVNF